MKTILATLTALCLTFGLTLTASAQRIQVNINSTTIIGNNNTVNNINQGQMLGQSMNQTAIQGNFNSVNNFNSGWTPVQPYSHPVHQTQMQPMSSGCSMVRPVQQLLPHAHRHHHSGGLIQPVGMLQRPVFNQTHIQGNFNSVHNFNH